MLTTPITLAHALILGLPAYLLLSRRWRLQWWHGLLGGFLIGIVPIGAYAVWEIVSGGQEPAAALIGIPLLFGLSGAVGGYVFWLLMRSPESVISA